MLWPKSLKNKIRKDIRLADHTSFRIGGRAKYFFEPEDADALREALIFARESGMRVFILGSGTNILADDSGVDGLVIRLGGRGFCGCVRKGNRIIAGSGLKLSKLVLFSRREGLGGLEFLAGIPGSVGGSLAGNAGAWGKSIAQAVSRAGVLDYRGRLRIISSGAMKFSYRRCSLEKFIVLWAEFKLRHAAEAEVAGRIADYLERRRQSQGDRLPSAGCAFKNPAGKSAGKLIDLCGLKGVKAGQAVVSLKHANFILNSGKAKSGDVLALMGLMRKDVKNKFGITMETEVKIWK
ncbi:MAG: UDP-N-acetylmuramate dehydrogenase [Candidatus Omnitrophica bacterium]|jgi:UDP-N-acetylmuramate dehydrogenase|nr:UDP-N-acetylmuramate dehydrogenase [Candidatus Omnitrophota bacterium]MDD3274157.1 UDP-N-acetylmuramate dehydrogenase [Candidatus Omnitrophota bacterium]MDD5077525.1 UDP-N-acetylmuramate dehydrogenase [Candidatus Omnitrophota bacterium]MDD5724569.1 UDP-N-acetylmuramate dehydrogenase [Candidatus Omnitrophota bacterium]